MSARAAGISQAHVPLVMLPGTLCTPALWEPMMRAHPALRARALDASVLGEGSADALVQRLLHTLPPRFALMGFSLGAIVALELVAQAPERVCGVALIAGNARPDPVDNLPLRRRAMRDARRLGLTAFVRDALWPLYVASRRQADAALLALVCEMAEAVGLEAFSLQNELVMTRADSRLRLHRIDVPTLIVSGGQDVINPEDRQRELYEGIRGARWKIVADSGHFVPLEAPDESGAEVSDWLDALDC